MSEKIITIFGTGRAKAGDAAYEMAYRAGKVLAEAGSHSKGRALHPRWNSAFAVYCINAGYPRKNSRLSRGDTLFTA